VAERDGVQLGEPVAVSGAAEEDRELVAASLQQRLLKTGGQLVKHALYYWLLLAESDLTRRLFGSMVPRLAALSAPGIELAVADEKTGQHIGSGLEWCPKIA
jgi:hypothetical protein